MNKKKSPNKSQIIHQWLIAQIETHEIRIGDQLPTEKMIMEQFQVNRTTVRTALAKLEKAGMIVRRSGKGTFLITDSPPQFVRNFNRLELVDSDAVSGTTTYRTIEKKWVVPPKNVQLLLDSKGEEHLTFSRVVAVDDQPTLMEQTYLSEKLSDIFTDLDTNQPYYPLIEKYGGEKLAYVKINFTATKPNPEQQKLLQVDEHHPCIRLRSQLYNTKHEILEYVEALYRGDKYLFSLESLCYLPPHL
ncbi:GntR family transcriptional regulator [Desulforhopalus singaporensis]|nr:GntR family transcriptional regulator [Desulforhopalus singaporensis]